MKKVQGHKIVLNLFLGEKVKAEDEENLKDYQKNF